MNPATPCVTVDSANCNNCQGTVEYQAPGVPLSLSRVGETGTIISISGKEEVKRFLNELGFTPGAEVKAVSQSNGNMILDVKGSKIAIDRSMAQKILICPTR